MRTIRCSTWTVLVAALLADVAPAPSCGSSRERRLPGYLRVSASDCSCASGDIHVFVDGRETTLVTCGPTGTAVTVAPGTHQVTAQGPTGVWPSRTFVANSGESVQVELGCPTR